jgi:predicted dehydrogenase
MGEMRVGVIGTGFGQRVVAPSFEKAEGCRVVDVVSPRDQVAIEALCSREDVDLISVHSPPFMHLDHVRLAAGAGHAVLCDKPFGRNATEAQAMHDLAVAAGVVNLVNFEMRFDPLRENLRALVQGGAVGQPEHYSCVSYLAITRVPLRRYGWIFDAGAGGGWIGAWGSHIVDFVRWSFGEVAEASAATTTRIAQRPDRDGQMHTCDADDTFTATLVTDTGATATIEGTSVAPINQSTRTVVIGSEAVLEVVSDRTITRTDGAGTREEYTTDQGGADLSVPMGRWAAKVRDAVMDGKVDESAPTFVDGLACRRLLDRLVAGTRRQA